MVIILDLSGELLPDGYSQNVINLTCARGDIIKLLSNTELLYRVSGLA